MLTRALRIGAAALALITAFDTSAIAQTPATPTISTAQTQPAAQAPTAPQTPATGTLGSYPRFELGAGYQALHAPDQWFPFGLNVDGVWNTANGLGIVGEIGWAMDSEDTDDATELSMHAWNFGVGPRWTGRAAMLWPYAQFLVGALHARSSTEFEQGGANVDVDVSDTRFMLQPGVGVMLVTGDGWGVNAGVDYRRVFLDEEEFGESGENQFRIVVGLRMLLD